MSIRSESGKRPHRILDQRGHLARNLRFRATLQGQQRAVALASG